MAEKTEVCLLNSKLAEGKEIKNKRLSSVSVEADRIFLVLVAARLPVDFAYYKLIEKNVPLFIVVW